MFGSLLGLATKVVTLPVDVGAAAFDVVINNGDGSPQSRTDPRTLNPLGDVELVRDELVRSLRDLDHY